MPLHNNTPLTRAHHLQTKTRVCSVFVSAQAGEDLVPEQKDEREEAEKRDAAVLHSIPPVLMRDGAKGPDVISRSSTNCDNNDNNVNNTRITNILKHPLNNSFFIEFVNFSLRSCDFILLRLFLCMPQAFSMNSNCKGMHFFKNKYIKIILFVFLLKRTVIICNL